MLRQIGTPWSVGGMAVPAQKASKRSSPSTTPSDTLGKPPQKGLCARAEPAANFYKQPATVPISARERSTKEISRDGCKRLRSSSGKNYWRKSPRHPFSVSGSQIPRNGTLCPRPPRCWNYTTDTKPLEITSGMCEHVQSSCVPGSPICANAAMSKDAPQASMYHKEPVPEMCRHVGAAWVAYARTCTRGTASTRDIRTAWRLCSIARGTGKPAAPRASMNANSLAAASLDSHSQLRAGNTHICKCYGASRWYWQTRTLSEHQNSWSEPDTAIIWSSGHKSKWCWSTLCCRISQPLSMGQH